jgi:hypothetical protein
MSFAVALGRYVPMLAAIPSYSALAHRRYDHIEDLGEAVVRKALAELETGTHGSSNT